MKHEEYEIEEDPAEAIPKHFQQPISQIELAKKMARYYELKTEIELMKERLDELTKELKEAGKGEESVMAGDYAAFFTKVTGRVTTDWPRFLNEFVIPKIGKLQEGDMTPFIKRGEDTVRMEVKKLR